MMHGSYLVGVISARGKIHIFFSCHTSTRGEIATLLDDSFSISSLCMNYISFCVKAKTTKYTTYCSPLLSSTV